MKKKLEKKVSQCRKNRKGPFGGFPTSILSQNSKKIEGETLWGKIFFPEKKSHNAEKTERGTLRSHPVWFVTRENGKPFWFISLGQMVQFGAIIFCRTFVGLF